MERSGTGRRSRSSRISLTPSRAQTAPLQSAAAIFVALLLAAEVARLTAAAQLSETRPGLAERLAPNSPDVLLSTAMAEVGEAAGQSQLPAAATMERLRQLARSAPLHEQPLLVEAAIAQRSGDFARAETLLVEARRRAPRSAAARFLLAEIWLGQGRAVEGLGELAILTRVMRGGADSLAPALVQFARSPGGAKQLKGILRSHPHLARPLLSTLAADPANASLIFDLAGVSATQRGEPAPRWQGKLLDAMIAQGDYQNAYTLWRRLAGLPSEVKPLLFNGDLREIPAPPPFNWKFASGGAGFAEPGNGAMRVLHYGRQDVVLASQLLLLPPGRYRFQAGLAGNPAPASLSWRLKCASGTTLLQLDVAKATGAQFQVPQGNCPAQMLELGGLDQDMPRETDVRIGPVAIERAGS